MTFQWQDKRWHVRLYLWAEPIVAEFFDRSSHTYNYRSSYEIITNLCPYMRTILLWLPLALLCNLLTAAMLIGLVTYLPGKMFGWKGYGLTLLGIAIAIGIIVAAFEIGIRIGRRRREKQRNTIAVPAHDPTPGFRSAVREWTHKAHESICPGITIKVGGGSK